MCQMFITKSEIEHACRIAQRVAPELVPFAENLRHMSETTEFFDEEAALILEHIRLAERYSGRVHSRSETGRGS